MMILYECVEGLDENGTMPGALVKLLESCCGLDARNIWQGSVVIKLVISYAQQAHACD